MIITQKYVNELAYKIVGCAIRVHKELGPGLLESVYEECLVIECRSIGLIVERQKELNVVYKGEDTGKKFRLDVLIEDLIISELKSAESLHPINQAQLLSHMSLAKKPKGLLINFNCINLVKEGLIPLVNEYFRSLPVE